MEPATPNKKLATAIIPKVRVAAGGGEECQREACPSPGACSYPKHTQRDSHTLPADILSLE